MTPNTPSVQRQPLWFLVLFAMAAGGGAIAYVPLLTVLLPVKVTAMMGEGDVGGLARLAFFGAIMASLANIAFGWASDRTGSRLPWIVGGLIGSNVLLVAIGRVDSFQLLVATIMFWQIFLNMMLGPLFAWAGDCVPDEQKGVLGGFLSVAPAMGALSGSFVTLESVVAPQYRLATVALLVTLLVLPVVIAGSGRRRAALMEPLEGPSRDEERRERSRSTVARMWFARLLIQISEAGLFAFLLFWLRSLIVDFHENTAANIFSIVLVASVPLSLLVGRWSDRSGKPILPLPISAVFASAGLATMAMAGELAMAITGYVIFGIAASIFLALHTSQTLRVLPKPQHRGRDLGIFNLTNTVPSIVMPWLTLALVPGFGFSGLFALFAGLALLAAILLFIMPRAQQQT